MGLTRYGRREWLGGGIVALAVAALGGGLWLAGIPEAGIPIAAFSVVAWTALAAFFRDPRRLPPPDADLLVSPADGRVRDIELITDPEVTAWFGGGNAVRVGIFLSVLDVHLNRAPCDLTVRERVARTGVFHDARDEHAITENEAVTIIGEGRGPAGTMSVAVRQISGAIARRIVCAAGPGTELKRGERYGMIKFGSRTELYVPAAADVVILVRVGDRVYGGKTPMARWPVQRGGGA